MTEIKPCPFCGSEPLMNENRCGDVIITQILCKCGAKMYRCIDKNQNIDNVKRVLVSNWNKRV